MDKEFVPYKEALALKELGFDEQCLMFYRGKNKELVYCKDYERFKNSSYVDKTSVSAQLYQQAFKWFRKKYNLHIEIRSYTAKFFTIVIQECKDIVKYIEYGGMNLKFNTYEEAELVCLQKLIEIVKNNGF